MAAVGIDGRSGPIRTQIAERVTSGPIRGGAAPTRRRARLTTLGGAS